MKIAFWIVLFAALGAGLWYHQGGDPDLLWEDAKQLTAELRGPEVRWQYVDEKGRVQIVETREEVPEQWREKAGRIEIEPVKASARAKPTALAGKAPAKDVVFYTSPGCIYCKRTRRWLEKNDVVFREVDVTEDRSAVDHLYKVAGQAVTPSVEIDGEVVIGYDPDRLEALLGG